MPQQFDDYLAALREKAEGTYSWWAWLKEDFILVGSVCSIFVCCGMILFMGYSGVALLGNLREEAYKTTLAVILKAFCYGMAAFLISPYQVGLQKSIPDLELDNI